MESFSDHRPCLTKNDAPSRRSGDKRDLKRGRQKPKTLYPRDQHVGIEQTPVNACPPCRTRTETESLPLVAATNEMYKDLIMVFLSFASCCTVCSSTIFRVYLQRLSSARRVFHRPSCRSSSRRSSRSTLSFPFLFLLRTRTCCVLRKQQTR